MTVGSLFAGIGGFDLGLERAGFTIKWQVEIDEYCRRVLAKHWPGVKRYGDIKTIDWSEVKSVDLICGGFPCQDISLAGKRAGIDGERSGLWSEYVRCIRALRPRFIIVENVPGLLTNEYMGRVLGTLAESGYHAVWDCLPAQAFGSPQYRDRVFIVAYAASLGLAPDQIKTRIFEQGSQSEPFIGTWRGQLTRDLRGRLRFAPDGEFYRMADGLSEAMDRLACLGNAIVPQIAEWLGRQIKEVTT